MRLLPLLPFLLALTALILGFLSLFAGSKPDFLESYSILTLNVSRIGQNIIDSGSSSSSSSTIGSFFHNLTGDIVSELEGDINNRAASLAKDLGLQDFYSVHVMDYCHGFYVPGAVKNATVHDIKRNVTGCSKTKAMFAFDPTQALENSLNASGKLGGETASKVLDSIDWPQDLEKGLRALRAAFKAQFVLYCIALGLTFLTMLSCFFWLFSGGRAGACADITMGFSAFLFMAIASSIGTAIAVKGSHVINKYGNDIGVSADQGSGFLGLTWAATACLLLASIVGCAGCFGVHKRRRSLKPYQGEK
ncbi:uncharacterized protein PV09_07485 [Verruconis gallopava]|uniref:Actin cortical patch SUR7/pH-response regulator PalI n=1 Tax=Verruconis gallopava TaxID=253628 RepID=A0A0D2A2I6_9PEZI|nr:uncharacterized protein PV09_07485 [Verruconis gallopava]KIW00963.1 hypothetical protein PV09_07485 [Verruconis gallopava]